MSGSPPRGGDPLSATTDGPGPPHCIPLGRPTMYPPFETERFILCAVGGLALILGLAELLVAYVAPRLARWWPTALIPALALAGVGLAMAGAEPHWWVAPVALAPCALLLAA